MFKHPRLLLILSNVATCAIALSLWSCATLTKGPSQVRLQQLETVHLAFIDKYTCAEGTPATWDQASFDGKVAEITQLFTDQEAAESKAVPARKEFIRNSAKLFQNDAALVRKQHCLRPSFAANKKRQLRQNYDLVLQHPDLSPSPHPVPQ